MTDTALSDIVAGMADIFVKNAVEMKIPLVLSADAHFRADLDSMAPAAHAAHRGRAESHPLLTCRAVKEIKND